MLNRSRVVFADGRPRERQTGVVCAGPASSFEMLGDKLRELRGPDPERRNLALLLSRPPGCNQFSREASPNAAAPSAPAAPGVADSKTLHNYVVLGPADARLFYEYVKTHGKAPTWQARHDALVAAGFKPPLPDTLRKKLPKIPPKPAD